MTFSFTGLAWLFVSSAMGFFAYRTFKYWQKTRDNISKIFFYSSVFFILFTTPMSIIGLLFADSSQMIVKLMFVTPLIQGFGSFFALCVVIHRIFSEATRKLVFLTVFSFLIFLFLGGFASYLAVTTAQIRPFVDNFWSINWGVPPDVNILLPVSRLSSFLIGLVPLTIMLITEYIRAEDVYIKTRLRGFIFFYSLVIIMIFLEFVFFKLKSGPMLRDVIVITASIFFFISILQSPKSSSCPAKEIKQS